MPASEADFPLLVERARRGDGDALMQLFRHSEREVRIIARVYLGPALRSELDASDLVQSVHRILLERLPHDPVAFTSPAMLVRLAGAIARRKLALRCRRLRNREPAGADGDLARLLESALCPDPDPAACALEKDLIRQFLAKLDEEDRRAVELRLHGYSIEETAREMDVSSARLRMRLLRLRAELKEMHFFEDWLVDAFLED